LSGVTQVALSSARACALVGGGEVYCWGNNGFGALGNGGTADQHRPVRVETAAGVPLAGVIALSLGTTHSCALASPGDVYCWGEGGFGQLGDGQFLDSSRPVRVQRAADLPLSDVVELSASSGQHSCARRTSGAVYCWGLNDFGQVGTGVSGSTGRATRVLTASGALDASTGPRTLANASCASSSGALYCWGHNYYGQVGDGYSYYYDSYSAVPVVDASLMPLSGVVGFGAGDRHACALTAIGNVVCWGDNSAGQLGNPGFSTANYAVSAFGN
jgi:alpha-tubulin suppressor-like RCC1 family protein